LKLLVVIARKEEEEYVVGCSLLLPVMVDREIY